MKNLKRKTFGVLVSILSLLLLCVLALANIDASNKYDDIEHMLTRVNNSMLEPIGPNNDFKKPPAELDETIESIKAKRQSFILYSILIFILLEALNIYISFLLTKWLVRPAEEAFIKQRQFISDASHELKTPLAVILASAEMLEKNPAESKYLQNIEQETEKMNHLVLNLLELSRTENLKNSQVFENINLSNLVEDKSLSFESLLFEQNLKLKLNITPNIFLHCAPDRIKELLAILIDNATKHAYPKSTITISLTQPKTSILLQVKNRGNAIPKSEREKIFERFYRIDKSRSRDSESYGLGLAIAKNIVTQHSGKISVDCKNGYTIFSIQF